MFKNHEVVKLPCLWILWVCSWKRRVRLCLDYTSLATFFNLSFGSITLFPAWSWEQQEEHHLNFPQSKNLKDSTIVSTTSQILVLFDLSASNLTISLYIDSWAKFLDRSPRMNIGYARYTVLIQRTTYSKDSSGNFNYHWIVGGSPTPTHNQPWYVFRSQATNVDTAGQ